MRKLLALRPSLTALLASLLTAGAVCLTSYDPGRVSRRGASLVPAVEPAASGQALSGGSHAQTDGSAGREEDGSFGSAYGRLPLSFEQNAGQFGREVSFAARGDGYSISLKPTEVVLHLRRPSRAAAEPASPAAAERSASRPAFDRISVRMSGANAAPRVKGDGRLAGVSNYFVGRDPAAWRTNVPTFARVEYASVYPGVDLIYYGNGRQLEYDFRLAPGADHRRIRLEFDGAQGLRLDENGDLVLRTGAGGELRQLKPVSYQVIGGERREVESRYALAGDGRAAFELGEYDPTYPLVIDPVISYSTFLGGTGFDEAHAVARGSDGSIYVAGETGSANFPSPSSAQASLGGAGDAFVLKLNAAGTSVVYATYVGGALNEEATGVAVDADGNAYVVGSTQSANFPVTAGALQPARGGTTDAFALKLNPSGTSLVYSTYLGGPATDTANGVAVDAQGRAHVGGFSHSPRVINGAPMQKAGSPAYKTTDSGATWQPSENGLDDSSATSFAIHPTDSNIVYAGTNIGVYKTTDGGATWQLTGSNAAGDPTLVTALALDPSNPSTLYVATLFGGVYKSTDGGASYAQSSLGLSTPLILTLVVDPLTPTTLYAGTEFDGVSKSTNAGASWTPVNNGMPNVSFGLRVSRLAIDPTNPSVVYAATTREGLFKTTNGGASWALSSNGLTFPSGSLRRANAVLVDPTAPSVLYAGTEFGGVYKSTDAGANWTPINNGLEIQVGSETFTFTVVSLAINPANPSVLYAATASGFGIFKTTDGGATWAASGAGIGNRNPNPNALELDRANPSTLYAGFFSGSDGFAVRLNAAGTAADYSVFLGGSENDAAADIALDASGNAYLTGTTASLDFPVVSPLQGSPGGGSDAFVAKLGPTGAALYSTYLGGNSTEEGRGIAVDASGRAHVTGLTRSSNFPTAGPRQTALNSFGSDLFVSRLAASGSALDYSVFHGGAGADEPQAIALDPAGNAYVTGQTASNDFPAVAPVQPNRVGNEDAFVLKLGAASEVIYSTCLGGSLSDRGHGVVADAAGAAYVVGRTQSSNFPVLAPLKATYSGSTDAFVTRLSPVADLALAAAASRNPVMVNNNLTYTFTLRNNGPDPAAAVRLSDTLPAGATFVSAAASQGSCAGTTTVACELGDLAPQATATVTVVVKPTATGALNNSATATSDTPDPNPGDNSAGLTTNVSALPSIAGRVALPAGPLAGVTVSLSGTQSAATQTSAAGFYQFAELAQGGSYTVSPARPGYVFHPQTRSFNNLTADETADFAAVACNFTVSPENRSFAAAGGTGTITISAPDSLCPWTAQSSAPWITITSAASGTGSAVVSFSVAPATVAGRAGTITIAGRVFTVWQELNACGAPNFHVAKRSPVDGSANDSAEADFNSDGRLDLVVVRELPGSTSTRLTLLLGDGAGGFGQPTDLPLTPTPTGSLRSVRAADFNGDGKPDLVVGAFVSRSVLILLGDGAGGFGPATSFASGLFNSTTEVFAADLNADGKTDVATGSVNEHMFAVLYGAGDGTLGAPRTFGGLGQPSNPESFAAGDLNGDGKPELLVGSGGSVGVYINDGAGGFTFARTLFNAGGIFVSLADLNGDSKLDLVGLSQSGVGVLLGQGDGNFAAPIVAAVGGFNRHLLVSDLNGDGKLDVAAATSFGVVTLFGDGTGRLGSSVSYQTGSTPNRVALADLDADGRPDLFSTEGRHISTLFGRGGGLFEAARNYPAGFQPQDVAAADFNSDGRLDLVAGVRGVNGAPGGVSFLAGDGAGRFAAPVHVPAGDQLLSLVVADFNGDGRPDVAGTRHDSASVAVLLGDGAGGFAPAASFAVGQFPRGLAAGDFNGDGKADLAVTDAGGPLSTGRVAVLLGNGAGGFGAATGHAVAGGPFAVAAADLNADGRLDIVASSLQNSSGNNGSFLAVLLGDGAGGFAPAVNHTVNNQQGALFIANVSLVAGDFNGDGRADVAAPLPPANSIAVLHGDGAGGFAQPETYPAGTQPRDLVSDDFNGDGKPDLAVASWDSSTVSVLLGRGTGGFESPATYLTSQNPGGLAAGDFDGDARTDLATTSFGAGIFGSGDATIFLNACAPPSVVQPPVVQFSAAAYQVGEGDGRATVTITRSGDTSGAAAVDYRSADADTFTVGCADAVGAQGSAYGRCDFATTVGTLTFAAGETSKTVTVPVIDDGHAEGAETFQLRLEKVSGASLGSPVVASITVQDNDAANAANPVHGPPYNFFVRQQYLDFLSREPDAAGLNAWLGVLNDCQPNAHTGPEVQSGCDRIHVSGEGFFRSVEFSLKGAYVFRFYKVSFNRLPEYLEIVSDMSFVAGQTEAEVFQRRAQLATLFTQRQEFLTLYGGITNQQYVSALLARYGLQQVTTRDPANPDTGAKVVLTAAALAALPRDKALRAVVDSDEVNSAEFDNAFVGMQYYGYLRRKPEPSGFEAWLRVLKSGDTRTMVNGFLNSQEYRLRFGQP